MLAGQAADVSVARIPVENWFVEVMVVTDKDVDELVVETVFVNETLEEVISVVETLEEETSVVEASLRTTDSETVRDTRESGWASPVDAWTHIASDKWTRFEYVRRMVVAQAKHSGGERDGIKYL